MGAFIPPGFRQRNAGASAVTRPLQRLWQPRSRQYCHRRVCRPLLIAANHCSGLFASMRCYQRRVFQRSYKAGAVAFMSNHRRGPP